MDLIWKALAENDPSFDRLRLFCRKDPASGALSVIQSNHITGITYEENFADDFLYLVEVVLPENCFLKVIEVEWSYLEQLEEEERGELLQAIGSIKSVEDIAIRGSSDDSSKIRLNQLQRIVAQATQLKHLFVDVAEIAVPDKSEMGQFAQVLADCHHLESLHFSPFTCSSNDREGFFDSLFHTLSKTEKLKRVHLSHKVQSADENEDDDAEQEQEDASILVGHSVLNGICQLPELQSLTIINMGLDDDHCQVLEESLAESTSLQRLVLLDNDRISDNGNKALLRLLRKNRSIFASLYGIDVDSPHRFEQLTLLHMNRCGRRTMRAGLGAATKEWVDYLTMINDTVPEEFDLDALFSAVTENPEVVRLHQRETCNVRAMDCEGAPTTEGFAHERQPLNEEQKLKLTEKSLSEKEEELLELQSRLEEKERQLLEMEQHLSGLGLYVGKVGSMSPTSSLQFPYEPSDEKIVHE